MKPYRDETLMAWTRTALQAALANGDAQLAAPYREAEAILESRLNGSGSSVKPMIIAPECDRCHAPLRPADPADPEAIWVCTRAGCGGAFHDGEDVGFA